MIPSIQSTASAIYTAFYNNRTTSKCYILPCGFRYAIDSYNLFIGDQSIISYQSNLITVNTFYLDGGEWNNEDVDIDFSSSYNSDWHIIRLS